MAESNTTRLGLRKWGADTDTPGREEFNTSHAQLEDKALRRVKGSRPEASLEYSGAIHYSSTTTAAGVMSVCDGVEWTEIDASKVGTVDDIGVLDGTADPGSTGLLVYQNHRHAYADGGIPLSAFVNGTANRVVGYSSFAIRQLTRLPKITLANLADNTPNRVLGFNDDGQVALVSPSVEEDSVALSDFANGTANKVLGFNADGTPATVDNVPDGSVGLSQLAKGTANNVLGYNASGAPEYKAGVSPSGRSAQLSHLAEGTPNKFLGYDASGNVVETDVIFSSSNRLGLGKFTTGGANTVWQFGSGGAAQATAIDYDNQSVTIAKLAHAATVTVPRALSFHDDTGAPIRYDLGRTDLIDLSSIKSNEDAANKAIGFDGSGVPTPLDRVPSGSVGISQLANGTSGKFLGYNADGEPAEVDRYADNTATLATLSHAPSAGYDKVLGFGSSGPTYLDRVPDNSVTLAKLAHGTSDRIIGFNDSGEPVELSRNNVTRHSFSHSGQILNDATYHLDFPSGTDIRGKPVFVYMTEEGYSTGGTNSQFMLIPNDPETNLDLFVVTYGSYEHPSSIFLRYINSTRLAVVESFAGFLRYEIVVYT